LTTMSDDEVDELDSMDLTEDEKISIRKSSTPRLQMLLGRAGYEVDKTLALDRMGLMVTYGKYILNKRVTKSAELSDRDLKVRELELREQELYFRREEAAATEDWRRRDAKKGDEELALKAKELDLEAMRQHNELQRENTLDRKLKRYGDALRYSMVEMSDEPGELHHFFTTLESVYESFGVPSDIQSKLLLPLVSKQAKQLLSRLTSDQLADYEVVRDFLLAEFRLTSSQYRDRFQTTSKVPSETFTLYCSKIKSLFMYYLKSKQVGDDFNLLVDLMVADRLKLELPSECLKYILSVEGAKTLPCNKIATDADIFMSTHFADGRPKTAIRPINKGSYGTPYRFNNYAQVGEAQVMAPRGPGPNYPSRGPNLAATGRFTSPTGVKLCFRCGSDTHLASWHYYNNVSNNGATRVNCEQQTQRPATVHIRHAACSTQHELPQDLQQPILPEYCTQHDDDTLQIMEGLHSLSCDEQMYVNDNGRSARENVDSENEWLYNVDINCDINAANCCAVTRQIVRERAAGEPIRLAQMQYRDISIKELGGANCYKALVDSGAELCVMRRELVAGRDVTGLGQIRLRGIVGESVPAQLVELHVKPAVRVSVCGENGEWEERVDNIGPSIPVIFAVCQLSTDHDIILSAETVDRLENLRAYNILSVNTRSQTAAARAAVGTAAAAPPVRVSDKPVTFGGTPLGPGADVSLRSQERGEFSQSAEIEVVRKEQRDDPTLAGGYR